MERQQSVEESPGGNESAMTINGRGGGGGNSTTTSSNTNNNFGGQQTLAMTTLHQQQQQFNTNNPALDPNQRIWTLSADNYNMGRGRGHSRSVSHGGGSLQLNSGSAGLQARPLKSAMKGSGHQRALSHSDQLLREVDEPPSTKPNIHGHNRVGSKTDFILPQGHKDSDDNTTSLVQAATTYGHRRQASKTESIYTLRRARRLPWWRRVINRRESVAFNHNYRLIVPNHILPSNIPRKEHPNAKYKGNQVNTTKYTWLTFLPKNLYEQFHRIANLYFIFIVILNWIPSISAFGKEVSLIPVVFVLGITMVKDWFEDLRRKSSDERVNGLTCRVYCSAEERYKKTDWKDVMVGDLVHLSNNETVPADILLLRCSNEHGTCYIETCDLDGETFLKRRQVVSSYEEAYLSFSPSKFTSYVEVEPPSTKIYKFDGAVLTPEGGRIPVSTDNLLLRESKLKNIDFIEGLVVYAGHETKAMLNNSGPRYKRSNLERCMNIDIIWCVVILFVLCLAGAIGHYQWLANFLPHQVPFLAPDYNPGLEGMFAFWTLIIVLQVMIPLSLYVTLEFCKIIQVYYIHRCEQLYDAATGKKTFCRALNITEELGQIQYIFSDKTGTITENKMMFKRCCIAGVDYQHETSTGFEINTELKQVTSGNKPVPLTEMNLTNEFFTTLAICNTVIVSAQPHHDAMNASGLVESSLEGDLDLDVRLDNNDHPDNISDRPKKRYYFLQDSNEQVILKRTKKVFKSVVGKLPRVQPVMSARRKLNSKFTPSTGSSSSIRPFFEAESPDELALVNAAYEYEYKLFNRTSKNITLSLPNGSTQEYEMLQVLPFDSDRKCMSIVVRKLDTNEIILYSKGADSAIIPMLRDVSNSIEQTRLMNVMNERIDNYARQGLRVLLMAKRELTPQQWDEWKVQHQELELCKNNRESRIQDSFSDLETDLTLVGVTGIEDKLQSRVPETISSLLAAGIIIWILTGDKMETAINIAYSSKLFSQQMQIIKLTVQSRDEAERTVKHYLSEILDDVTTLERKERALVVDGKTLVFFLDRRSNLLKPFLQLTTNCASVLCVRATPLQKAYLVKIVKQELKKITLAVGDGANDVSMIQMANVGVGIFGQEGRQSVMASDFSIPQFRHLENLLLVFGHWNYDRLCRCITYFFYKNVCLVFILFWYQFFCGFSGTVVLDAMYFMLYNFVFTSVPPMLIGIYDKRISEDLLMGFPYLYEHGRDRQGYNPRIFWVTIADAFFQSLIILFVPVLAYWDTPTGQWEFGTTVISSCLIVMLLHCAIEIKIWTYLHVLSLVLSLGSFYLFALFYTTVCVSCLGLPSNYGVLVACLTTIEYYAIILLTIVLALLPRFFTKAFLNTIYPDESIKVVLQSRKRSNSDNNKKYTIHARQSPQQSSPRPQAQRNDNLTYRKKSTSISTD